GCAFHIQRGAQSDSGNLLSHQPGETNGLPARRRSRCRVRENVDRICSRRRDSRRCGTFEAGSGRERESEGVGWYKRLEDDARDATGGSRSHWDKCEFEDSGGMVVHEARGVAYFYRTEGYPV